MHLQDFDIALFLRDSWQKKPLLIRNPWADWRNPLDPDELAGLACEKDVEARLITHAGDSWAVEHGPLPEARFGMLGQSHWTLLVQAVDHHAPDVAALVDPFRFVPNWRIDDVMVSYAVDGGSVGPHFDQYDVFLIQGLGRRRWQVGGRCDESTPLLPHDDLRLLATFDAAEEWVLEPGDILYVPPGIAHHGVAVGDDCMTYSVGFRAPSRSDLIGGWCDDLLERLSDDDRYTDPDLQAQDNPGEISDTALTRLHAMVTAELLDRDAFARWFGEYNSARKYSEADWRPQEPVAAEDIGSLLADGLPLCRNPASRFSFVRQGEGAVLLFVDGQSFACSGEVATLAERLCAQDSIPLTPGQLSLDSVPRLIAALYNQGSIAFDEEE
ncbi:MAG TPA: cupin domain-containing protein [Sphingobium sp.]